MMPLKKILTCLTLSFSALAVTAAEANLIFDGETLNGWVQKNGTASYRVEDGMIIGKTVEGSPNSFLCSTKNYGDFVLTFDVKFIGAPFNSGCQIRSRIRETEGSKRQEKKGRLYGPQVEIEVSGSKGAEGGYIYGEATGRGWLTPKERLIPHKKFKDKQWNTYKIVAKGPRIQTWINGQKVEDLIDHEIYKTHPTGVLGLQVHSVKKGTGPFQVAWKNIKIREL